MTSSTPEQRIEIGADVMGTDGEKLGSIAYVVVRPPEMHVTDVVVSTGALLGRDVVVPVDAVDRVSDGKIYLSLDKEGLERCEDYVEVKFEQPPETWIQSTGIYYPASATLWPVGMNYPQPSSIEVHAPPGTVGLHEGMDVVSSDGHKVGTVDALDTDPTSEDVTAIVVKEGFLSKHDRRVPVEDIASVKDDKVTLKLSKDELGSS